MHRVTVRLLVAEAIDEGTEAVALPVLVEPDGVLAGHLECFQGQRLVRLRLLYGGAPAFDQGPLLGIESQSPYSVIVSHQVNRRHAVIKRQFTMN